MTMTKEQFQIRLGYMVTDRAWEIIKTVEDYHPAIKNEGKDLVRLYREYGLLIIKDMFHRAEEIKVLEKKKEKLREEIQEIDGFIMLFSTEDEDYT